MKIKDLQKEEKPREKMIEKGSDILTDVELLAIIIRSGGKNNSATNLSRELILKFGNQLNYFRAIILYFIVNIGVDIYYGLDPRNGKGFFKNVDILIILTIILTFIIVISAYYYKNKIFKNNGFS